MTTKNKFDCVKCGNDAEGDENGYQWLGPEGLKICKSCASHRLWALENILGAGFQHEQEGALISWWELDRLLKSLPRDYNKRTRVLHGELTDLKAYEWELS